MIYLDTHAAIRLRAGDLDWIDRQTRKVLETSDILISPMVLLELRYLHEIGRLKLDPDVLVNDLGATIGLRVCQIPFHEVVREASSVGWTRDPFDRMIVAQAMAQRAHLLTKDASILENYRKAIQ